MSAAGDNYSAKPTMRLPDFNTAPLEREVIATPRSATRNGVRVLFSQPAIKLAKRRGF